MSAPIMCSRLYNAIVIDDDEIDQMLYRRIFERTDSFGKIENYTMAADALERLADPNGDTIDIIFLDINMPGMNGFEFLDEAQRRFGERFTGTVVIMLTSSLNEADKKRAASFPLIKRYLNKPLTFETLTEIVSALGP